MGKTFARLGWDVVAQLFVYNRTGWRTKWRSPVTPSHNHDQQRGTGRLRFGVMVFENTTKYPETDKWNKELLDKYATEFNVWILGFIQNQDETSGRIPYLNAPFSGSLGRGYPVKAAAKVLNCPSVYT